MTSGRNLVGDGIWVAALQGAAAVGQLAGIRLLTEVLPPTVFGQVMLLIGAVALVASAMANPTMQGLLRFYPEYALTGQGQAAREGANSQLLKFFAWSAPLWVAAGISAVLAGWLESADLFLLGALACLDVIRTRDMALLNAHRAHRLFGIWGVMEAWSRPLLAFALVTQFGVATSYVLVGFLVASAMTWAVMRRFVPADPVVTLSKLDHSSISGRLWRYTLPLLPLGLLGWVAGMADRYMIGTMLSAADVGLYVAIYGLASRPMLMIGGVVETTIRPAYQQALVERDNQKAHGYLKKWVQIILISSLAAITLFWVGHSWLARIMLGENYRVVSYLLPWIAAGYSLLILSYVANRVCYANEATKRILLIEGAGAVLAVVVGFAGIHLAGLAGAAGATIIYFGIQLVISYRMASPWLQNNSQKTIR